MTLKKLTVTVTVTFLICHNFLAIVGFSQTSTLPERIMLNPLEAGSYGVAVTWRCPLNVTESYIQWKLADPHPVRDLSLFEKKKAYARIDSVSYNGGLGVFQSYRVQLDNLSPGKKYMYRVGNDNAGWSEWTQFTLPSAHPDSAFTFIYMGDPQNDLYSQWSRTIRQAYTTAPNASFILYAGDLVNRGYNDTEWRDWYKAGDFIHRMIPSIMTPGNHEYTDVILTPLWKSHFTLPENGPTEVEELYGACYYIDYPAVRIISLDGEQIDEDPKMRQDQLEWLENVLKNTKQSWTIVTLHYPFFSTKPNRDNVKLREAFKPVLDKYQVDLVLQGHDHAYGRGIVDENGPSDSGTMYVVSVSGPKMYDLGDDSWMEKRGENIQLYQVITLENDQLKYKSYTTTGELFDQFTLTKNNKKYAME